jgi:hypothetical protein
MICQLQESPSLCDGKEGRAGAASENPQVYSSIHSLFLFTLFNAASSAATQSYSIVPEDAGFSI